jgi:hypothetical protein
MKVLRANKTPVVDAYISEVNIADDNTTTIRLCTVAKHTTYYLLVTPEDMRDIGQMVVKELSSKIEEKRSTAMNYAVYVRAKTSDDKWASVNAVYLDGYSYRRFVMNSLARAGIVSAIKDEKDEPYKTPLTKEEAENG